VDVIWWIYGLLFTLYYKIRLIIFKLLFIIFLFIIFYLLFLDILRPCFLISRSEIPFLFTGTEFIYTQIT